MAYKSLFPGNIFNIIITFSGPLTKFSLGFLWDIFVISKLFFCYFLWSVFIWFIIFFFEIIAK